MSAPARTARSAQQQDLAYHQARVLLLVAAASQHSGHQKKIDGLTKLAKLDFLVRYPALAPRVLPELAASDEGDDVAPEAPMIRYKYGPWDDRYYPVIGALVGRGLVKYVRGRRGSVALRTTAEGSALASVLADSAEWAALAEQCAVVTEASQGLTGSTLKRLIYEQLASEMDRPHREAIS